MVSWKLIFESKRCKSAGTETTNENADTTDKKVAEKAVNRKKLNFVILTHLTSWGSTSRC